MLPLGGDEQRIQPAGEGRLAAELAGSPCYDFALRSDRCSPRLFVRGAGRIGRTISCAKVVEC
jgi:hypothetical protein